MKIAPLFLTTILSTSVFSNEYIVCKHKENGKIQCEDGLYSQTNESAFKKDHPKNDPKNFNVSKAVGSAWQGRNLKKFVDANGKITIAISTVGDVALHRFQSQKSQVLGTQETAPKNIKEHASSYQEGVENLFELAKKKGLVSNQNGVLSVSIEPSQMNTLYALAASVRA